MGTITGRHLGLAFKLHIREHMPWISFHAFEPAQRLTRRAIRNLITIEPLCNPGG